MPQPLKAVVQLIAAASGYAVLGFLLYRARVTSESAIWDSDLLVFYGPAIAALAIVTTIAWRAFNSQQNRALRLTLSIASGAAVTFLAACAYATVAFTRYGTCARECQGVTVPSRHLPRKSPVTSERSL